MDDSFVPVRLIQSKEKFRIYRYIDIATDVDDAKAAFKFCEKELYEY